MSDKLKKTASVAVQEMIKFGLLQEGWLFEFDDAKTRFGQCDYRNKIIRLSRLICSTASEDSILNTILHEIAHAIVGFRHNHDEIWRMTAISIGCNGERCHSEDLSEHANCIAECPGCNKVYSRMRIPKPGIRQSCSKCSSSFNSKYLLIWKENK